MHEPYLRVRQVSSSYLKCFQQSPQVGAFTKDATSAMPLDRSYGPVTSGLVGPNSPTQGTSSAPAMWSKPVSTPTTRSHLSSRPATLSRDVWTGIASEPACAKALCIELSGLSQKRRVRQPCARRCSSNFSQLARDQRLMTMLVIGTRPT